MNKNHFNIESLESRTLFAGLDDVAGEVLAETEVHVIACEGAVRSVGEALVLAGSYMEAPGLALQEIGTGIYDYFAEIPEYPAGGIYRGLSVELLSGAGSVVSALGLIPVVAGTAISYVGMAGELLYDHGDSDAFSVSNSVKALGETIASVGSAISDCGANFSDAQRYAPKYADFVEAHENSLLTIAGTHTGGAVNLVGLAVQLPGYLVHKTGDLTITTCNVFGAVNQLASNTYASVSGLFGDYFTSSEVHLA